MRFIGLTAILALMAPCITHGEPWAKQRPARRTSVRAALASKTDPNFWPARGRRSSPSTNERRQTAQDEEGPFWANRGRAIDEERMIALAIRQTDPNGPFWANRGRGLDMDEFDNKQKWFNHQARSKNSPRSPDEGPFWANRGRSKDDKRGEVEGPFWANRGRSTDDKRGEVEGPFWANRGRSLDDKRSGVWMNGGRNDDKRGEAEGPFWANRGRSAANEVFSTLTGFPRARRRDVITLDKVKLATIPVAISNIDPPKGGIFEDLREALMKDKFEITKMQKNE